MSKISDWITAFNAVAKNNDQLSVQNSTLSETSEAPAAQTQSKADKAEEIRKRAEQHRTEWNGIVLEYKRKNEIERPSYRYVPGILNACSSEMGGKCPYSPGITWERVDYDTVRFDGYGVLSGCGSEFDEGSNCLGETIAEINPYSYDWPDPMWQPNRWLKHAIIGEDITAVEDTAFMGCVELKKITYEGTHTQFTKEYKPEKAIFTTSPGNPNQGTCGGNLTWKLSDRVLTISGYGAMGDYTYSPWSSQMIERVVMQPGVSSIGAYAFYNCAHITEITIPGTVMSIGKKAFCECHRLSKITISKGVTKIGEGAFMYCSALTSIELPEGIQSIEPITFTGCISLNQITIPGSVMSIGNDAFAQCGELNHIIFPEGVKYIENHIFYRGTYPCISLPVSVKKIGEAFVAPSGPREIRYAGTKAQWEQIDIVENGNSWAYPLDEKIVHLQGSK